MRSRVYSFQFLLGMASAAFLRSETHGTHEHILLSQFLDSANLRQLQIDSMRNLGTDRIGNTISNISSIVVSRHYWLGRRKNIASYRRFLLCVYGAVA
jgi:hypothetical protein